MLIFLKRVKETNLLVSFFYFSDDDLENSL